MTDDGFNAGIATGGGKNQMREEFELWARAEPRRWTLEYNPRNLQEYDRPYIQITWEAWQAAYRLPAAVGKFINQQCDDNRRLTDELNSLRAKLADKNNEPGPPEVVVHQRVIRERDAYKAAYLRAVAELMEANISLQQAQDELLANQQGKNT